MRNEYARVSLDVCVPDRSCVRPWTVPSSMEPGGAQLEDAAAQLASAEYHMADDVSALVALLAFGRNRLAHIPRAVTKRTVSHPARSVYPHLRALIRGHRTASGRA